MTSEDPEKLVTLYPAFFDKILLDAPCSGEGMFRKESSMLRYYSENGPEHYVPIQKKLIEQAYQMLAEGGELLYSTCTFSVKENEEVIAGLLDAHPDMEVQEITPGYEGFAPGVSVNGRDLSRCVHIFPQRMEGEGHFVALLKKQGESRKRQPSRLLETTKKLPKEAEEFLAGVRMDWKNGSFALVKDQLYFLPEGVCAAKGLRYLRTGLSLGTVKKNRFEPSQALAAYLKTYSKRTVRNIFWSANNYTLPTKPAEMGCQITYWYGEEEKQARHSNICFIKQYFPRAQLHEIPKMDHAELVMMYPQDFYRRIMEFLTHTSAAQNKKS